MTTITDPPRKKPVPLPRRRVGTKETNEAPPANGGHTCSVSSPSGRGLAAVDHPPIDRFPPTIDDSATRGDRGNFAQRADNRRAPSGEHDSNLCTFGGNSPIVPKNNQPSLDSDFDLGLDSKVSSPAPSSIETVVIPNPDLGLKVSPFDKLVLDSSASNLEPGSLETLQIISTDSNPSPAKQNSTISGQTTDSALEIHCIPENPSSVPDSLEDRKDNPAVAERERLQLFMVAGDRIDFANTLNSADSLPEAEYLETREDLLAGPNPSKNLILPSESSELQLQVPEKENLASTSSLSKEKEVEEDDYMIPESKTRGLSSVPIRAAPPPPPPPRNSPIPRIDPTPPIPLKTRDSILVPNNSPVKELTLVDKTADIEPPVRFRRQVSDVEDPGRRTVILNDQERSTFVIEDVQQDDQANRESIGSSDNETLLPAPRSESRSSSSSIGSSVLVFGSEDLGASREGIYEMMSSNPSPSREYMNQIEFFGLQSSRRDLETRITPERFVPQEYSSSPIVEHLANSREQRPSPPLFNSPNITNDTEETEEKIEPPIEKPGLLEQIVRSHPIWFLQSFSRTTASHLLKTMRPGTFIVRGSSRPSAMALSIRLPDGHEIDVDHYVIELCAREKLVRLESSPYSFNSLPILVEHYCRRGEELQCLLRLPEAVRACATTSALHSLALMGADFWTSSMALSSIGSAASSSSSSSSPLSSRIPRFEKAPEEAKTKDFTKKRPFSFRSKSGDHRRKGTLNAETLLYSARNQETPSPTSRQERGIPPSPILTQRGEILGRTPSSRNQKKKNEPCSPSLSGSRGDGNRRSFLRSLFSFGASNSNSPEKASPITQLATCHYFVPQSESSLAQKIKSSRSAYELQQPFNEDRVFGAGPSMRTFKSTNQQGLNGAPASPIANLRRERSDLNSPIINPGARIAKHLEGSPGPTNMTNSPRSDRVPLKPPQNAFDQNAMRNCVEELRRKRLQTADEMLRGESSGDSSNGDPQQGPQVVIRPRLTGGSWRGPSREQRLSVPNMPDETVLHSARAIREKIGRTEAGEVGAINEGLVTPVVRRKQFTTLNPSTSPNEPESMSTGSEEERKEVPIHGTVSRNRDALEAILDPSRKPEMGFPRRYHSERSRSSRQPDVPIKLEAAPPRKQSPTEETNNNHRKPQPHPPQPGPSSTWGAVAGELRSRQKVAKVRPTPQVRSAHQKAGNNNNNNNNNHLGPMAVKEETAPNSRSHSDYAQLGDFQLCSPNSTAPNSSTSSLLLAPKDEDAVSVAGTVFNEPWDSNVWENLLDLAQHGDPRPTRMNETIAEEEDTNSERTGGSSSQMQDSDDELEMPLSTSLYSTATRKIPSDHVTVKAWEKESTHYGNFSTLDSRRSGSQRGTLGRSERLPSPEPSMHSLPRALSRFSETCVGSLDDLANLQNLTSFSPLISSPRKRPQQIDDPGASVIQKYVEKLAESETTVFGATVRRFIECTVEGEESDPMVVIRNVRQFINGIKNYLVKHGEGDLHELITIETSRLNANQILNIDALLEAVLHKILLRPVKPHLYHLMVKEQSRSGTLQALSSNLALAKSLSLRELGFRNPEQLTAPSTNTMEQIKVCLRKMQHHYSPLKKLENLLRAVSLVAQPDRWSEDEEPVGTLKRTPSINIPNADDLVRWFVYLLSRTSTVGCEVEAWYMWELLPQQMITQGDASFYLGALFSAVHILKSSEAIRRMSDDAHVRSTLDLSRACSSQSSLSSDAFLRVAVPDEVNGCIRYCTLPGVPQMTVSKICKVVAHQQGITNPEDYGLYILRSGFEDCLHPSDSPFLVREVARTHQTPHLFVYKRHDAKIAWPQQLPVARSPAIGSHTMPQLSI